MSSAIFPLDQIPAPLKKRFDKTLEFIKSSDHTPKKILDLGPDNTFAKIMRNEGYDVVNTDFEDLDINPEFVRQFDDVDCITSFQLFEHMVAPYNVLKELPRVRMFVSIPLKLWFSKAYNNPKDPWDRHYHEFEDWQFDWVLRKAGWKIIRSEKWKSTTGGLGFRPILRNFYPRFYILEVEPMTEEEMEKQELTH